MHHEIANRIVDNISGLNISNKIASSLEIGAIDGYLSSQIDAQKKIVIDLDLQADEEFLPFKDNSFDLVVSNLNMHLINEIPKFLIDVKNSLKEGGIFVASFFGEENLSELAHVLYITENEIYGGVSPKMPPTIDVKTSANLLAKAGFKNPISNFEKIEVEYFDPMNFFKDLKNMGQGNILNKRSRRFMTREFLNKISDNYRKIYGNSEGKITATFEVITITAWK